MAHPGEEGVEKKTLASSRIESLRFSYQIETDAFQNLGKQPTSLEQWEGQTYGYFTYENNLEIVTPKAFTRVNYVEFNSKTAMKLGGGPQSKDKLVEYKWNSDYELVGMTAYTKKVKYERHTIGNEEVRIVDLVAYLGVILVDIPCVKAAFCPAPAPPSQCALSVNQAQ